MNVEALVLGGGGMLGRATARAARDDGLAVDSFTREQLDLTDTEAVSSCLHKDRPSVVFNCAAFTAVDACESEPERAMEVNGYAVGRLAEVCQRADVGLIHISSDYVFGGQDPACPGGEIRTEPHREDEEVAPCSVYGESKELGERLALASGATVVRASWLFGPDGANFVETMLRLADGGGDIKVVDDQVGCPTYTPELARVLVVLARRLVEQKAEEIHRPSAGELFHYGNPPAVSWHGFARGIFEVFQRQVNLQPCTTVEFPRPAPRPAYSALDTSKIEQQLGVEPSTWFDCLRDYRRRRDGVVKSPVGDSSPGGADDALDKQSVGD